MGEMKKIEKNKGKKVSPGMCVVLFLLAPILGIVMVVAGQYISSEAQKCEEKGGVYNLVSCRDKTIDELFAEKCIDGISKDPFAESKHFSCEEIAAMGLKRAYVESGLVIHGNNLYEKGTDEEIEAGKRAHDYCVEARESWNYINEKTCVILNYSYLACASGHCYLDEKQEYKSGFVAYFPQNYSWDSFRNAFYGKGPVVVCGIIEAYDGHPQITVNNINRQIGFRPARMSVGKNNYYYPNNCWIMEAFSE